jgi:hypothetical protein
MADTDGSRTPLTRAGELHRRGVAAIGSARPLAGARLLRAGLAQLGWPHAFEGNGNGSQAAHVDGSALAARLLISLASAEVQLGHPDEGFGLLDRAAALVAPHDQGVLLQQRGLLLVLVGRMEEGLSAMDSAIPLLTRADHPQVLARTLLNRAMLHFIAGRVRQARADLDRCERIARANDMHLELAKVAHNRGYCDLLDGDVPAALRAFQAAIRGYQVHGEQWVAVVRVDMARLLLTAGLPAEAGRQLDAAMGSLRRQRLSQETAEAELTRAQVALAAGDLAGARGWARRAARRFNRRGNHTWAAVADLGWLRADLDQGRQLAAVASRAGELADRLAGLQLSNDAELAALLGARADIALGRRPQASGVLEQHRRPKLLENRLQRRLALAELAAARGRRAHTLANARAGLAELDQHRSRFGSVDLQTGAATLGKELARLGLATALRAGAPAQVFSWLERSRAQAFRVQQVRPHADADTVALVAELRQLATVARGAELGGRRDLAAERRCVELEREIRARDWQRDGTGQHRTQAQLPEVMAELGAVPALMLSYLVDGETLRALAITEKSARLVDLGGWTRLAEPMARLRSDLDALCGRRLPPALDAVIRTSVNRQLDEITAVLLGPVRRLLADRSLVIVPTRALSALPWGLLPDIRGRPVVVSPSASSWLRARRSETVDWSAQQPLLVAGPNLEHADAEIEAITGVYPDSVALTGEAATVAATLKQADGRGIVHIAAHGHHEPDNVLFSRLDLSDGPLMAHDVQQLAAAPRHVVLSCCDVGRTVVRTGDELLGFTAALLYGGTRSVVSSVSRVADDVAIRVMSGYHRALAHGVDPPQALADAAATEPLTPFVCFGG